jgi:hypothetical protein
MQQASVVSNILINGSIHDDITNPTRTKEVSNMKGAEGRLHCLEMELKCTSLRGECRKQRHCSDAQSVPCPRVDANAASAEVKPA